MSDGYANKRRGPVPTDPSGRPDLEAQASRGSSAVEENGEMSPGAAGEPDRQEGGPPRSPPPPRGPALRAILLILVIAGAALVAGVVWSDPIASGFQRLKGVATEAGHAHGVDAHDDQYWTCGMHPWVILPDSGLCPICHMDLTPLDPDKLAGEITIDPVMVQNIGVRIAPVTTGPLRKEVRTVGAIAYNEAAVRDVNTKVGGWIQSLHVDETGVRVEQGQPLFELYSPALYAAQEEYLLAWRNRERGGGAMAPEAGHSTFDLLESARTRLEHFDVSEEQIQRLQETAQPTKTLTIASPHDGIVIDKHANEGMRIEPGMRVYQIADLSTVWVLVTIYEQDLPYVQVEQKATMTLPYLPDEQFEGEVVYLYPYLDEQSRAVKLRLEFPNPDHLLKPGMFATVRLERTLDRQAVLVPRDAVVSTGERQMAFVSLGGGRFEPREVRLGAETESGMAEVLEGLKPDEQVVVSGQFLLDSESKMRLALAKMVEGDLASEQRSVVPIAGASELATLPGAAAERISTLLAAYMAIGDALADDTLEGIGPRAQRIADAAAALPEVAIPDRPRFWVEQEDALATLSQQAVDLAEAPDLEIARSSYAILGDALDRLLLATGVPPSYDQPVHRFVCGWLEHAPRKGLWLQTAGELRNPLMGAASGMLACNIPDQHRLLPVTGQAPVPDAAPADQAAADADGEAEAPTPAQAGEMPPVVAEQLDQILRSYLAIGDKLVANTTEGVAPAAQRLASDLGELVEARVPGAPNSWQERPAAATARGKATELTEIESLPRARLIYAELSAALAELVAVTGVPPSLGEMALRSCPMFPPGESGAVWLQPAGRARNPYMGEGPMLECAGRETLLPPAPADGPPPPPEEAVEEGPAAASSRFPL